MRAVEVVVGKRGRGRLWSANHQIGDCWYDLMTVYEIAMKKERS